MIRRMVCRIWGHQWVLWADRAQYTCVRCRATSDWTDSIGVGMYPPGDSERPEGE